MLRVLYNRGFKTRIVQVSYAEWRVLILKQGWFQRWEQAVEVCIQQSESGGTLITIQPFHRSTIYEAHAFRNTISTEALFKEYAERQLGKILSVLEHLCNKDTNQQ